MACNIATTFVGSYRSKAMLLVFIDTNILFDHWYLRSPPFAVLANYISNKRGFLLVPDVVRQEVEAKFASKRDELRMTLTQDLRRATDFQSEPAVSAAPAMDEAYDFLKVATAKFDRVELLDVDSVAMSELVPRAVAQKRPFRENEKGFRDTAIWLALLNFLEEHSEWEPTLALISKNSIDFLDRTSEPAKLHADLQADLDSLSHPVKVTPFLTLKDFIKQEIDPAAHSVKYEDLTELHGDDMESMAGEAAERFLQDMQLQEMIAFLEHGGIPRELAKNILAFNAHDFEGVEDPMVHSASGLADGTLVLKFQFVLLTVRFTVVLDLDDYRRDQAQYDRYFMNADIEGRGVTLDLFRRCDFIASVSYSPKLDQLLSASIDQAAMRRSHSSPALKGP